MAHFVYMLACYGDRIYTGYTTDVERRFKEHQNKKGAHFTKVFKPQKILKVFELTSKSEALALEYKIKKSSREIKTSLIQGKLNLVDFVGEKIEETCIENKVEPQ